MVWKILRPHYWALDRRIRSTNPIVVIALLLLLGVGGQWVYDNLIRDNLALLNSEQAVTAIASFLPLQFFIVLLFAMLGVGDVMHQLFLASDLELLMIAPVPVRTIFLVKLLQCSRATLIPALVAGVFLLAFGLAREAAASYYLLIVLLILATMALATTAVMILVILLARFLPVQKVRSWMPVVVALVTLGLLLFQQSGTQWFLGQADLIKFLTEALLNPRQLGLLGAGFTGMAVVSILATFRIFDAAFHEGWNRFREVPTRKASASLLTRQIWSVSRLLQPLFGPLRFVLVKEWLELLRDPLSIINLTQPLVLVLVALAPFMTGGMGSEILRPLVFWYMLVLLALFLSFLPLGMPLMAIMREGRKIALLRSMPISMSDVLRGKLLAAWVSLVLPWVVVFLVTGLWLQYPLWQVGALVGIIIWGLAGASVATVAMGGLRANFTVEELKQRVPKGTTYLMMGLNLIFVLSTIASSVWLMVHFFPSSREVLTIRSLAGYDAIGWIFSDSPGIPLALVSIQIAFWVGVKLLWDAAVHRLEGWEES
jgi:hypothetical protein